jgi:hypothetical protein
MPAEAAEPAMPAEPAVTCKTVTQATVMPHKAVVSAVLAEEAPAVLAEEAPAVLAEEAPAVLVEEAPAAEAAPAVLVEHDRGREIVRYGLDRLRRGPVPPANEGATVRPSGTGRQPGTGSDHHFDNPKSPHCVLLVSAGRVFGRLRVGAEHRLYVQALPAGPSEVG